MEARTFEAAPGITGVDTFMAGRATVTSAYLIHAAEPTLVETGPTTSVAAVEAGLGARDLGPQDAATPPPDIDVDLGVRSIERIKERADGILLFSHFGPVTEVEELCDIAAARLRKWASIVRDAMDETDDLDRIAELLTHRTAGEFEE